MGEETAGSVNTVELDCPRVLPVQHLFEDESGNVCAVILDSSDVTYMPMLPVETTEEVILYDGMQDVKVEVDVNSDTGYQVIYTQKYSEQSTSPTEAKPQKKIIRRGQHKCKVCNKTFSQTINLVTHERIHTGEKPFVCSVCMKPFSQQPNLWKHMRTHTGERPYQCITCKKCFTQQANLSKHIRIHTGERPYTCQYCNKRFTQQANLTKHVRLHTGERPFHCRYCQKTFVQQSNLERHERIHTGVKPFKCKVCGDSFAQNAHLAKHLRTVHKSVVNPVNAKPFYMRVAKSEEDEFADVKNDVEVNSDVVNDGQCNLDSKKIGIPVLYCTKTGKIIKRVD